MSILAGIPTSLHALLGDRKTLVVRAFTVTLGEKSARTHPFTFKAAVISNFEQAGRTEPFSVLLTLELYSIENIDFLQYYVPPHITSPINTGTPGEIYRPFCNPLVLNYPSFFPFPAHVYPQWSISPISTFSFCCFGA